MMLIAEGQPLATGLLTHTGHQLNSKNKSLQYQHSSKLIDPVKVIAGSPLELNHHARLNPFCSPYRVRSHESGT
jgi:hypothetical protein